MRLAVKGPFSAGVSAKDGNAGVSPHPLCFFFDSDLEDVVGCIGVDMLHFSWVTSNFSVVMMWKVEEFVVAFDRVVDGGHIEER